MSGDDAGFGPVAACALGDNGVVELRVQQCEGEAAVATLTLLQRVWEENGKGWCTLYHQKESPYPIFCGRHVGLARVKPGGLVEVNYVAVAPSALDDLKVLVALLKKGALYDGLFYDDDNPVQVLEGRSNLFYWDRLTGNVSVCDVFAGRSTVDISPYVMAGSLKQRMTGRPLAGVDVTLEANWVQRAQGEFNLYPYLERAFTAGRINTLTPESLLNGWPKVGDRLGTSPGQGNAGYQVVESRLSPLDSGGLIRRRGFGGALSGGAPCGAVRDGGALRGRGGGLAYATLTPEMVFVDKGQTVPYRFERFWFEGRLVVAWQYHQKRREKAHLSLNQHTLLPGQTQGRRHIHIRLGALDQALPHSAAGSFFTTTRGHGAMAYGLEIARAYLAASARCMEIEIKLPIECLGLISVDTSVRLASPELPGGEITGKITAYRAVQRYLKSFIWVKIAACVGTGELIHHNAAVNPLTYSPDYGGIDTAGAVQTPTGIRFKTVYENLPTQGMGNPIKLNPGDFVQHIKAIYDGDEQIDALQSGQYPQTQSWQGILGTHPTAIEIALTNLETWPCLEHNLTVESLTTYSAPQHLIMEREHGV
jgi:hypothetical protein